MTKIILFEELVVYEENGKYYYYLDRVNKDGPACETDDRGPFESWQDAVEDGLEFYLFRK